MHRFKILDHWFSTFNSRHPSLLKEQFCGYNLPVKQTKWSITLGTLEFLLHPGWEPLFYTMFSEQAALEIMICSLSKYLIRIIFLQNFQFLWNNFR